MNNAAQYSRRGSSDSSDTIVKQSLAISSGGSFCFRSPTAASRCYEISRRAVALWRRRTRRCMRRLVVTLDVLAGVDAPSTSPAHITSARQSPNNGLGRANEIQGAPSSGQKFKKNNF